MTELQALLVRYDACDEARLWAKPYATLAEAWAACERADWMLWLAGRMAGDADGPPRRALVLCACACARTALKYVPDGELRPLHAIETAERWARNEGGVSPQDVAAAWAASAARAAARAAASAAARDAAWAASAAARDAAWAASAAARDAAWAASATARRGLAAIVRQHYPQPPEIA